MRRLYLTGFAGSLVLASALTACGSGDGSKPGPSPDGEGITGNESQLVVITIGNLTDLTGPSARGNDIVNMALEDVVRYANDEGLVPGAKLEVIEYDGQLDPSYHIPGYEWLRERGADMIWTGVPGAAAILGPRVDADGVVLFTMTINQGDLQSSGHVFNLGTVPDYDAYGLLKWIAENDWDYASLGPAKVGGAGWEDAYSPAVLAAAQTYCREHPDQFEWEGSYLTGFSFVWSAEVDALRDVDYVFPPSQMTSFLKQYRDDGGRGTIIGGEPQAAFLTLLDDGTLWDEADGTLVIRVSRWWNEEGPIIDFTRQVLEKYHPGSADGIMRAGSGYLGASQAYMVVEAIRSAVETVGVSAFDEDALYDAVQRLSITEDGFELYSLGETKRNAVNYYGIYEFAADGRDLFRVNNEWYPIQNAP